MVNIHLIQAFSPIYSHNWPNFYRVVEMEIFGGLNRVEVFFMSTKDWWKP